MYFVFSMIGSSTSSSLSAANASGGMGGIGGSGLQQLSGGRQDNVSMGGSGQSYELIKSTQVSL